MQISAPYILIGLLVAAIIKAFLKDEWIKKMIGGKGLKGVFWASIIGVPIPLCSCSVIPMATSLRKSGASNGATSSFLISTPESGIDSFFMTYSMMDPFMTLIRPISAFCSALMAGLLQSTFNEYEYQEKSVEKKTCCGHNHDHGHGHRTKVTSSLLDSLKKGFHYAFGQLINDMALWLLIGIVLGSMIDMFFPTSFFSELSGFEAKLMIILIGIPLYICASASTPIAASLIMKGLSPGSALLFLLVGPATNVSNMFVLQKFIGVKGVVINTVSIITIGLLFSFITDSFYDYYGPIHLSLLEHSHESLGLFSSVSAVILFSLIVKGIWKEHLQK